MTKITDPLSNETDFEYDDNGNLTKSTNAANIATDYFYDDQNRHTKVTTPSGGSTHTISVYNKLDQITSITDAESNVIDFAYDHVGRLIEQEDAIDAVAYGYDSFGNLWTTTDGLTHTWDYDYDAYNQFTKLTDPISKVTKYFYDLAGRTKVGAGSSGTTDPTEFAYDEPNALLTKVSYTSGGGTDEANYSYTAVGELTTITDWNSAVNGLRYV